MENDDRSFSENRENMESKYEDCTSSLSLEISGKSEVHIIPVI